jgi:RNA polymerase sigma factor, sigma-70 family
MFIHTDTTPEEELISQECTRKLNEAINNLPEKCKLTFKLVREEKMKYREVAEVLGISQKTVEAHLSKAVKILRQILSSE